MRTLLLAGAVLLSGCSAQAPGPAQVSWAYGAGNGDGVSYVGPKPVFKRAYGAGNGDSVTSGQTANMQYGYGADGMAGTMVQTSPEQRSQMAAPATPTTSPASGAERAPGSSI